MSALYGQVDGNGVVQQVVVWDGISPYQPQQGFTLVPIGDSGAWIGWSYVEGTFTPPLTE